MVFLKGADEYLLAETSVRCLEDTKLGRAAYEVEEGNMLLFNPPFHKTFHYIYIVCWLSFMSVLLLGSLFSASKSQSCS